MKFTEAAKEISCEPLVGSYILDLHILCAVADFSTRFLTSNHSEWIMYVKM